MFRKSLVICSTLAFAISVAAAADLPPAQAKLSAIQVFDGTQGWKLRPFLNRLVVEPYTTDEMKTTATQADLDGALGDYAAKDTKIELAGIETVEGRNMA